LCLVFRRENGHEFRAVASFPKIANLNEGRWDNDSLMHSAFQERKKLRLADVADPKEQLRVFGAQVGHATLVDKTTEWLQRPMRALAAAPIIVEGHVFAEIALFNTRHYLPEQFSWTDERMLVAVCEFLSAVIPSVETHSAMVRISEKIFSGSLQ